MNPNVINTGTLTSYLSSDLSAIANNPLTDLKFMIPVIMLVVAAIAMRGVSKRSKVDATPTLTQKIEPFHTPRDKFNIEVKRIMSDDYDYYVRLIDDRMKRVEEMRRSFVRYKKMYYVAARGITSPSKRRKTRAEKLRKDSFAAMLEIAKEMARWGAAPIVTEEFTR